MRLKRFITLGNCVFILQCYREKTHIPSDVILESSSTVSSIRQAEVVPSWLMRHWITAVENNPSLLQPHKAGDGLQWFLSHYLFHTITYFESSGDEDELGKPILTPSGNMLEVTFTTSLQAFREDVKAGKVQFSMLKNFGWIEIQNVQGTIQNEALALFILPSGERCRLLFANSGRIKKASAANLETKNTLVTSNSIRRAWLSPKFDDAMCLRAYSSKAERILFVVE